MNQTNDQAPSRPSIPNPREFMRARHPDLFSDTQVDDVSQLPRPVFEYHLDTLTNRKQEYEFEHFCRKLAEKEICPNLRVQTGPTGGGDSKVDTETYPVAEEIAERWWVGSPSAGAERWAFAFSAKKRWKSKVAADVDNILSTGRGYKHIYFFTNQFVSDKQRADQEDALSKHAKIPVHIIDRAWTDKEHLKHTDRLVLSPIDMPLWDQARWRGTLFAHLPDVPPILAIAFEDGKTGQDIFRAWKERWDDTDMDEVLRLTIITGLSKQNPAEYAVVAGPSLKQMAGNERKIIIYGSRINRMSPRTSANLDNFLTAYKKAGAFLLAPAQFPKDMTNPQMPFVQLAIRKRQLDLRQAWQISENDPDIVALAEDDEPIIPAGATNPPVEKALIRRRTFR